MATPTDAWNAFIAAAEVPACEAAFAGLLGALSINAVALTGRELFDAISAATQSSACPYRTKELVKTLGSHWARRPAPPPGAPLRVLITGAGPIGLRTAAECAMLGMRVEVVEKRAVFSRVNILTLWQQTAEDLAAFGAKLFYPAFTVHGELLHLGTREIQLTLLKACLLLGVTVRYCTQLSALQPMQQTVLRPPGSRPLWRAWVCAVDGAVPSKQAERADGADGAAASALAFKPAKSGDYQRGALQGRMNQLALSELDRTFALDASAPPPAGCTHLEFEALCVAEGEWSASCKRLGVAKAVDRFQTAIGLVVNLDASPAAPKALRSFVCQHGMGEPIARLERAGVKVENLEYLRGVTHYCAATLPKTTLLAARALRADLPAGELLLPANIDVEALRALGLQVARACGVPAESALCAQHGVQLFDFSTRARALCPFRLIAVRAARSGETDGRVVALDVEGQSTLAAARSAAHQREMDAAEQLVHERDEAVAAARRALAVAEASTIGVSGEPLAPDEKERLIAYQRAQLARAEEQAGAARAKVRARADEQSDWRRLLAAAEGAGSHVPVLPLGDALLEPFWPQGLGTNRGFHGALDGAWALRCLWADGLDACLLERAFTYDALLADFARGRVLPGGGWTADCLTRSHPDVVKGLMRSYQDPSSKRWFKGTDAIPSRYLPLARQALGAQRS